MVKLHKGQSKPLPNGRDRKGVPKFENWHCQMFPKDISTALWRSLTKTATDLAIICRAKHGHAASCGKKNNDGHPVFEFTAKEAEQVFKISRPTFLRGMQELESKGFITTERHGGISNGNGIPSLYRLCLGWDSYQPPPRDNTNILKARAARLTRKG